MDDGRIRMSDVPNGVDHHAENPRCIRAEACEYRDSIIHEADGLHLGVFPYWFGYAIVEAYVAGAESTKT